jgi:hypothetical protein
VSEAIYDAELAPALLAIGKRCEELGIAFLVYVEYEPGEIGRTRCLPKDASLGAHIVDICAGTAPNIDAYILNLGRFCKDHNIDTGASMVMRRTFGKEAPDA